MDKIIVGVATPTYPVNASRKDLVPVNRACKEALAARFPGAQVIYDGLSNGAKAVPQIRYYAKLPATDPTAAAILAANDGRRPTVGRGFKGAYLVDVSADGVTSTGVAGLSAEALGTKTLKDLQTIGATYNIKIANGTSKAKAILMLTGSNIVVPAVATSVGTDSEEAPSGAIVEDDAPVENEVVIQQDEAISMNVEAVTE